MAYEARLHNLQRLALNCLLSTSSNCIPFGL
jgi:hypothetical protein